MEDLLTDIEAFMVRHELSATTFGQRANGDRHFVRQLREGRETRRSTEAKIRNFMTASDAEASSEQAA